MQWHEEREVLFDTPVKLASFVRILVPVDTSRRKEAQADANTIHQQIITLQPGAKGLICRAISSAAFHVVCHKVNPYDNHQQA